MKALTFLEYTEMSNNVNQQEHYYWFIRHEFNNNKIGSIAPVYSQPFKPELIAELFEVTHFSIDTSNVYFEINDIPINIALVDFFKSDIPHFAIQYGDFTVELIPRTIEEFISDCQRAGIELEWRIK